MKPDLTEKKLALEQFVSKKKFVADKMYSGVGDERKRLGFEQEINALARSLLPLAEAKDPKDQVLGEFKRAYGAFELADTEDRERALGYFEEIMDIFGITSSDGLLNRLLYGFDVAEPVRSRNIAAFTGMNDDERATAQQLDVLPSEQIMPFLLEKFGKPATQTSELTMWVISAQQPMQAVSVARQMGKRVLIWTAMNRFTYSRVVD